MQAQLGRRRRAGARVVEREERRRATERGRDRVLEEPVGRRVRGHPRVGVDIDDARQDEHPGRVQDVSGLSLEPAEVRLDRLDAAAAHGHVRPARSRRRSRRSRRGPGGRATRSPAEHSVDAAPGGYRVAGSTSVMANVVRQRITISAGSSGTGSPFDTPLQDWAASWSKWPVTITSCQSADLHARVQAGRVDRPDRTRRSGTRRYRPARAGISAAGTCRPASPGRSSSRCRRRRWPRAG